MNLSADVISSLLTERAVHQGPLKPFVDLWADDLCVSQKTIYRILRKHGAGSGRIRKKQGSAVDEIAIERVAGMIYAGKRRNNKTTTPTPEAVRILEKNNLIPEGLSPSTWNRHLRRHKATAADIKREKAYMQIVTDYPNEMAQFDATPCLQAFLQDGKFVAANDINLEVSRKPEDLRKVKKHLIRWLYVDHYSGAFYFHYVYEAGERAIDVVNFLYKAMAEKSDGRYPLHGVPYHLWSDCGRAINNKRVKNLCENLDIDLTLHMPGNPRAKGLVEKVNDFVTNRFEGGLSSQTPRDLDELNRWAFDFCVRINHEEKTRKFDTRNNIWMQIKGDQLRQCPPEEIFKKCAHTDPEERTITANLQISFNGHQYRLPDNPAYNGTKALVRMNAWNTGQAEVTVFYGTDDETSLTLYPLPVMANGRVVDPEFAQKVGKPRAVKDSDTEKLKKTTEGFLAEYGMKAVGTAGKRRILPDDKFEGKRLNVFDNQLDDMPENVTPIPKKGIELPITKEAIREVTYSLIDVIEELAGELDRGLYASENEYLYSTYPKGMTDPQIKATLELFRNQDGQDKVVNLFTTG